MHSAAALNYICTTYRHRYVDPTLQGGPAAVKSRFEDVPHKKGKKQGGRAAERFGLSAPAAAGRPWRPRPSWEARLSVCPARTPSGGGQSEGLVCVCAILSYTKGSATRVRVPLSSSLMGEWTGSPAGFLSW